MRDNAAMSKTAPARQDRLAAFPAFFKVAGRDVAIFGDGDEAFAKARLLASTQARITLFGEPQGEAFRRFVAAERIAVVADTVAGRSDEFPPLSHFALVFAATGDAARDRAIVEAARAAKVPVNAVDQPDLCDFYTPAIVNRAPVAIAIGTEGAGPVLAQIIRARIDAMLPPSLGALARLAASYRHAAERLLPRGAARRDFWRRFFSGDVADNVAAGNLSAARRAATRLLRADAGVQGKVWLVGAGPGAADLLTLRAQRALMEAEAIFSDALVPAETVDMGRRDAERIPVGKRKGCHSKSQAEIDALLVALGRAGKRVVRLKSGDPLVFGRAAEEMAALREAGVAYEIVPGVTSAFAAAADFELPLTLRGVASSLVFTTGHDLKGDTLPDWAGLAVAGATVAVYMGRSVAAGVAARLIKAGLSPDTMVAVVENASRAGRRLLHGTVADLPGLETRDDLTGPVMAIIGDAVAAANLANSTPLAARCAVEAA